MRYDITIIGGGVIGCAIARELMRYKLRVVLVEKECEVGFGTSKANSGIIHAGHHSSPKTLKGQLEWEGNQAWDALAEDLGFGFKRIGELTIAMDDDQLETLRQLYQQGQEKGVTGLELWDAMRIRLEEPNLSHDVVGALYAPTAGVVNPYEACFSLIENARDNGLELLTNNPVLGISAEAGSLWVKTQHELIETQFVINAAGLFADKVAELAGVGDFKLRARKGEEYLLDKRLKGFIKRLIFPCPTPTSKGILVIPTFDGTLMVGPTAQEVNDKEDLSTTAAGSKEIFSKVKTFAPGLSERDCIAEFAGIRAVSSSEDFIIGPSSLKGFINVAGIQSPGLTAAPAIANRVVTLLHEEGLELKLNKAFVPGIKKPVHVAELSTDEQIALANQDTRYSRVLCRCEHISEGEIIDAIHRGARTLDGIKFRTRAGMGRCQGGFCTWRSMQLLSEELSQPLTSITKRGGNSWMVVERDDTQEKIEKVAEVST